LEIQEIEQKISQMKIWMEEEQRRVVATEMKKNADSKIQAEIEFRAKVELRKQQEMQPRFEGGKK
jgi:hypothetical protein